LPGPYAWLSHSIVDAKDDPAIAFCQHFNFLQLHGTPNRLYLPMKQVAKLC
tara:strand:+ start:4871 stop:5023 length:153 start_codon:yes stop_codon:yes gene_type:complete